MTHAQFAEWCAYDEIEPLGASPVCESLTAIGLLFAARYGAAIDARHFMPWTDGEVDASDAVLSPEQGAAFVRRLTSGT